MHFAPIPDVEVPALLTFFCAFVLRTTAAFGLAWIVARLGTSARFRFAVWLMYLVGIAAYWLCVSAEAAVILLSSHAGVALSASSSPAPQSVALSGSQIETLSLVLGVALIVYLFVVGLTIVRGVWRQMHLWHALRARIAPPPELTLLCQCVAEDAGIKVTRVWVLPSLTSAASSGIFRPAVYLPADACETSQSELHDIVCHEMTHIARHDGFWDVLLRACHTLLLFHPGAAYAARALRLERELACDREVVRAHPDRRDAYAETLVRFGWRFAPEADTFGLRFAAQSAVLSRRVKEILAGEPIYSRWSRGSRVLLSSAAVGALVASLPALCVVFGVILLPPLPAAHVVIGAAPFRQNPVRHSGPGRVARIQAVPTYAAPIAQVSAAGPVRAPRYQLYPSASAPMSDEVSLDSGTSSGQRISQADPKGLPSAPTLVTDAAVELARLASSRDHDHDMH